MGLFSKKSKSDYIGEVSYILERLNDIFGSEIIDNWLISELSKRVKVLKKDWDESYDVPKDFLYNADAMISMFSGDMQRALEQSQNSLNESKDRANYLAHKIRGYIFMHQGNNKLALVELEKSVKDLKELNKISKTLKDNGFYQGADDDDNYELEQLETLIKDFSSS